MAGPVTTRPVPPFRAVHALMGRARIAEQRRNFAEASRLRQSGQLMSKVASAQLRTRIRLNSGSAAATGGRERGSDQGYPTRNSAVYGSGTSQYKQNAVATGQ